MIKMATGTVYDYSYHKRFQWHSGLFGHKVTKIFFISKALTSHIQNPNLVVRPLQSCRAIKKMSHHSTPRYALPSQTIIQPSNEHLIHPYHFPPP